MSCEFPRYLQYFFCHAVLHIFAILSKSIASVCITFKKLPSLQQSAEQPPTVLSAISVWLDSTIDTGSQPICSIVSMSTCHFQMTMSVGVCPHALTPASIHLAVSSASARLDLISIAIAETAEVPSRMFPSP